MKQKVIIHKKLTDRQKFELLFREPTKEEKEIIKMNEEILKAKEEKKKLNKKTKYICKVHPKRVFAIKEDLGNEYHIMYYSYSGHALLYHQNKLLFIINENVSIPVMKEFHHVPWLYNMDKGFARICYDKTMYRSFYDHVYNEVVRERRVGPSRTRFSIIRKEKGQKYAV